MSDRWVPEVDERVWWTKDDLPGRLWRIRSLSPGNPPSCVIVCEPEAGSGVRTVEFAEVPLAELAPPTQGGAPA